MDIRVGDVIEMKKPHPCQSHMFAVMRTGMDIRLRCEGCGHEMLLPRAKVEKNLKKIIREEQNSDV